MHITKEEITGVSDFLADKKLLPENTRVRKTKDGFKVLIASALSDPLPEQRDTKESEWILEDGKEVKLVFGNHLNEIETISHHINARRVSNALCRANLGECPSLH
jgi:dipeptidyl-peptidase-3